MITAIVLSPDLRPGEDTGRARELIVRSLVWLVAAVVSGVVRQVVLASPDRLDLDDIVDQAGCELVQARRESERLDAAAGLSRSERLLVLKGAVEPEPGFVDELAAFLARTNAGESALVLAAPQTLWQRLFPDRAPVVGVLANRDLAAAAGDFSRLARSARHASRLRSRARPIF